SDPIALKGAERKVVDTNANVQLRVYTSRIRKHPLGGRIGKLLGSVYQWRDFFGPAALDPIRDVDQIVVVGPQFRDSSGVVAVLKLNVPDERVRIAIDALVKADPEGQWLDAGAPSAIAHADRAPREFVLPAPGIVVVTPPGSLADEAAKIGGRWQSMMRDSGGAEVVSAKVKTPWRALSGVFNAPKSIKWARAQVTPTADRGVLIEIEAEDESAETANENAAHLQTAVTAATQLDLGVFGAFLGSAQHRFVEKVEFTAQGSTIHGKLTLTEQQLLTALDLVAAYIGQPRQVRRAAPAAPQPSSSP
ncbi:MAG TPA: hypothetical protein VGP93_16830, partial [Polyangiaceae bacterium]|nr:hypothetical protein [Polyangiaceae bacterium]